MVVNGSIYIGAIIKFKNNDDKIAKISHIDRIFFENGNVKVAIMYTWTNDNHPYAIWPDDFYVLD